jgi:glycosyltransferase involved in cell wall biosynthesis
MVFSAGITWVVNAVAPPGSRRRDLLRDARARWKHLGPWTTLRIAAGLANRFQPLQLDDAQELLRGSHRGGLSSISPLEAEQDERGAARFALALLLRRGELRSRFPRAITQGAGSEYLAWLCSAGAEEFQLSSRAVEHLRGAFTRPWSESIAHQYDHSPDLQIAFPLAMMRCAQRRFAQWLLCEGRRVLDVHEEEAWWFLLQCAEDPTGGVTATYLRQPRWQERFPLGLTALGWDDLLAWLARQYGIEPGSLPVPAILSPSDELRLLRANACEFSSASDANWPDADHLAAGRLTGDRMPGFRSAYWQRRLQAAEARGDLEKPGVNVLAHFCFPSGLREAALSTVCALRKAGLDIACRNVPVNHPYAVSGHSHHLGLEIHDQSLLHVSPELPMGAYYSMAGLHMRQGVYRIGYWYWELEAVPRQWAEHAQFVREVWAPSRFVAQAMQKVMPVPVVPMFPGLELQPFTPTGRAHFGLPEDRCLFLFVFNMHSVMERKNPLAVIRAFRRAFRADDRAMLAIKVLYGDFDASNLARLKCEAAAAGVVVIDRCMSREETYALMETCDCYVSLHRSEGLGLTIAEAMLMGKPVIATGYSGNLDFMTRENSLLVDYQRVSIRQQLSHYPSGSQWADPSVEDAAHWMRWVYRNREEARGLGQRARAEVAGVLSTEAAGRRMAQRLDELRGKPGAFREAG